jgi:GAF domain-containing protein
MLSTRDYKSILDLIHLIYEIDDRAVMFKALCDALPKLVPIKSAAFAPFSTGTSELEFPGALMYNLQPYPLCLFAQYYAARQPYLIAIASRDPRSYLNKATNITDVVPSARLKHTEYGTDFQPIAGVLYEACITVAAQGDRLGIMGLHRAPGDRDFTSREQRILNVLFRT